MKFSIKDFFSKCDQLYRNLRIWSHLLEKSLMENFIFLCNVRYDDTRSFNFFSFSKHFVLYGQIISYEEIYS